MKTLLFTPPLLQPNTPYAATPLLTAWLRSWGHEAVQADLSLELLLRLFSSEGVRVVADRLGKEQLVDGYLNTIDEVIAFLQGRNPGTAVRLATRGWLPEGGHLMRAYAQEEQLGWNFRGMDVHNRAKYLASIYLDDVAAMASRLDSRFGFSRYAEKLSASLPSFAPLREALEQESSLFMEWLFNLVDEHMERHRPDLVALTVPFPGCLFGALAVARRIRQTHPTVHVTLGGGYVNTELRTLQDPGVFAYVDTITLDSGFLPLQRLVDRVDRSQWVRTYALEDGVVCFYDADVPEVKQDDLPPPDYSDLPMNRYFGMMELLNPAACLWSESRWNKLMLAQGCCWSRCAFCDTSIDYICRYDPAGPKTICDWIEQIMDQTGFNGFHFVDEALPPDLIAVLCDEMIHRDLHIEWWGNVRFEKRFNRALIRKMADAGCIAVTGGLETCCNRTLTLMRKGIRVEVATHVLHDFSDAGILTHAYLMYGFPTQTLDETVDALETVRGLFAGNVLHSAFWHRFALTAHSEISTHPDRYDIEVDPSPATVFAVNEIPFRARFNYDLNAVGQVLRKATYNYQLGVGLDWAVEDWFAADK